MKNHPQLPGFLICIVLGVSLTVTGSGQSGAKPETAPIQLRVSVTDPLNRYVTDLKKENFKLSEDRAVQTIQYFEDSSAPICVAIVMDSTPTLRMQVDGVREVIRNLVGSGNPSDAVILITFEQRTAQIETFTRAGVKATKSASFGILPTISELQDAVFVALEELRKSTISKRAIAVVTDSGAPKISAALEIAGQSKDTDLQIFSISRGGGPKPATSFPAVETTAGSSYFVGDFSETNYYVGLIVSEVRNQYILGYTSSNARTDRKSRKLSVELELPPNAPKLQVKYKKGYDIPKK
jgi:hypothetical protein